MSDSKQKKEDLAFREDVAIDTMVNKGYILSDKHSISKVSVTSTNYGAADSDSVITDIEGYEETLMWTEEEETCVRRKIDFLLMPFMLLMAFVLNMDRTNLCKSYRYFFFIVNFYYYYYYWKKNHGADIYSNYFFTKANAISDNLAEDLGFSKYCYS